MTILEIVLLVLLGISGTGNIVQLVTGIKIEVSQQQVSQNFNMNVNDNINLNLINSTFLLTNISINSSVVDGRTNFYMSYNYFSTNMTAKMMQVLAVTNQSNWMKVGLYKK